MLLLSLWALADPVKKSHVESELVSDQAVVAPGSTFWVALRLQMDPEWHTYWQYPGDAGLATEITWTLPEGVKAGPLQWPVPEKLASQGLVSFGYSGEAYLLTEFQTSPDLKPGPLPLRGRVSFLACKESCIPGKADLELTLQAGPAAQPSAQAATLEQARQKLPQPFEGTPQVYLENGSLFIPLGDPAQQAAFFPFGADQIVLDSPQTVVDTNLQLKPADPAPKRISGVLVLNEKGFTLDVPVGDKAAAAPPAPASKATFWPALIGAFLGGLVLNLMPCVFPVLSLKVLSFVEAAGEEKGKPWIHGALYSVGVLLSFWALAGALLAFKSAGEGVGWGFQNQYPVVIIAQALLFFGVGLNLLGVFEVGVGLTRLSDVADRKTGLAGALWGGVLATLVATPCTAPFMGAAINFALAAPAVQTLLIFTALGVGMAFPYMLLTSVPAMLRFVPRPGPWMESFKQFLAFPMLAAAGYMVWILGQQSGVDAMALLVEALVLFGMAGWAYGRWGFAVKAGTRAKGMGFALLLVGCGLSLSYLASQAEASAPVPGSGPTSGEIWQPFSPERLAELRGQGKPVFVDFTAAWCFSCQVNEKTGLRPEEVQKAFRDRGIVLLKADWTKRDENITRELAKFNRSGVPLYVLYPAQGEPMVLPEVPLLTPSIVLKALEPIPLLTSSSAG